LVVNIICRLYIAIGVVSIWLLLLLFGVAEDLFDFLAGNYLFVSRIIRRFRCNFRLFAFKGIT